MRKGRGMTQADWLPPKVRAAGTERALKRGQTLFRAGQRTVGLYEIASGTVRLVRFDPSGREVVLHNAHAGETIAEASLFSEAYHCDAIATTAARVRLYPKGALLAEFARDPEAARPFMARLGHQVMTLRTLLERQSIRSARERVRHYLAVNVGADGRTIVLPGTLKELAADLGLSHEALYRTLARMTAEGEIKRLRGAIKLT
jgi:CRP/FNR family transcriptional regulator, dissimilatory nitrate respiration regulator